MLDTLVCPKPYPLYLIIQNLEAAGIPPLLYYSHVTVAIVGALFAFYIIFQGRSLLHKILFVLFMSPAVWAFMDLILWTHPDTRMIMFLWSSITYPEIILAGASIYFLDVFINRRDMAFYKKAIFVAAASPLIILGTHPVFSIEGILVDVLCEAEQGWFFTNYEAYFGIAVFLWIVGTAVYHLSKRGTKNKGQIALASAGIILFYIFFWTTIIIGFITGSWINDQYTLLGTLIFAGVLTYLITRYKVLNVKLFAAQSLVVIMWVLVASLLLIPNTTSLRIVAGITLALIIVFGFSLIRSVRREIEQREQLDKANAELKDLNDNLETKVQAQTVEVRKAYEVEKKARTELEKLDKAKDQFILTTQHHLRTPLTIVKGYIEKIVVSDSNSTIGDIKTDAGKASDATDRLSKLINELLDISQYEVGSNTTNLERTDISELVADIQRRLQKDIDRKELKFNVSFTDGAKKTLLSLDKANFSNALGNLIDNAVKYTPAKGSVKIHGFIAVHPIDKTQHYKINIIDTGIGLSESDLEHLFGHTFERGEEAEKINIGGQGINLVLTKKVIEANGGRIYAESPGKNQGSTFTVEIPLSEN